MAVYSKITNTYTKNFGRSSAAPWSVYALTGGLPRSHKPYRMEPRVVSGQVSHDFARSIVNRKRFDSEFEAPPSCPMSSR